MSDFRFVHTADVHLDSPLKGLSGQEGRAADRIRRATRDAFDGLITRIIEEEASFVIIAGDLYDGDWRDYHTGLFFTQQIGRLSRAGIPAYLLYGNHDAESQLTRKLTLPENVHTFKSRKAESFHIKSLNVAIHGQSFARRDIDENLVPGYPDPEEGWFNIGVLHTALGGQEGHANYAPCSLDELINKGYDYWALGHVHQHAVLHERPHIIYPGNLQGRHIREVGPKGACLISVEDGEVAGVAPLSADVVRWAVIPISVSGCDRIEDINARVGAAIAEAAARSADSRLLACRVELRGRTPLHSQLLSFREQLIAEARAAAIALGEEAAWVEKIALDTEPEADPKDLAAREDAVGELQRILDAAGEDPELKAKLEADIGELLKKLPYELRAEAEDPALLSAIRADYSGLIRQASHHLAASLAVEGN
jgi:DNA repair protein SbcD/Mre11